MKSDYFRFHKFTNAKAMIQVWKPLSMQVKVIRVRVIIWTLNAFNLKALENSRKYNGTNRLRNRILSSELIYIKIMHGHNITPNSRKIVAQSFHNTSYSRGTAVAMNSKIAVLLVSQNVAFKQHRNHFQFLVT